MTLSNIKPFVPSGKDFKKSKELFLAMGFEIMWESEGYVGFHKDSVSFILQDYENKELAQNLMIQIEVEDLDELWRELEQKEITKKFEVKLREPTVFPYGREIHFIDIAGVCWHFAEK
ncbi:MAG: hypothetical protein AAFN93_13350 [Bacteroidota bacterium]